MVTVALVGGDGAGKTSIAKMLEESSTFSVKYLYMGPSILSSNKTLPTSRLARYLKLRALEKENIDPGPDMYEPVSSNDFHYKPVKRNAIWLTFRLINRIAEASSRYLISLGYQWRGHLVIYDRFFLFSVNPSSISGIRNYAQLIDYLEYIFFYYFYPKPNLVIFLDASPRVLYTRKGEADTEWLSKRRKVILEMGKTIHNFVRVDATQPLESVYSEVTRVIDEYREKNTAKSKRLSV